jgi:SH3 domain-containing YSC84-like protein 1
MEIRATTLAFAISAMVLLAAPLSAAQKNKQSLEDAVTALREIMATSDKAIPQSLLEKAHCAVVIPALKKGAFLFGARYGKGYISCRRASGPGWSAPATVRVEGAISDCRSE